MVSVDKMITSFSSFWDTSATTQIEGSLNRLKLTIEKFGNVANEIQGFVASEKLQFSRIMTNVEGITENLRKNNDQITAILGNAEKITDDFVTTDYKTVVLNANIALEKFNLILENIDNGNGTLWKLINDDKLYKDLVETNNELQNLVTDIRINPERYINFSLIGRKNKGVVLTPEEEIKLINLLDSIPD
jgi:phospholipid/cholesterol/gamma-HCH transport system substrate-binding protein